jgi:hypothetical protein
MLELAERAGSLPAPKSRLRPKAMARATSFGRPIQLLFRPDRAITRDRPSLCRSSGTIAVGKVKGDAGGNWTGKEIDYRCCARGSDGPCQETTSHCPDPQDRVRCPKQGPARSAVYRGLRRIRSGFR